MRAYVLNSGSSGNLTVVEAAGARIVLDAGLGPNMAAERMHSLGCDLFPVGALGIVVTHHHGDHVSKVTQLARALKAPVFMHEGIDVPRIRKQIPVTAYAPGTPFRLGPFVVESIAVPHDAPQVALRIEAEGVSFGLATDIGQPTAALVELLGRCDVALLEANHCPRMLAEGPYPERLRARVRGPFGHLSNEQTGEIVARLAGSRVTRVVLGHLSRPNNTPERALAVVRASAGRIPVEVLAHGDSRALDVTPGRPVQLALRLG